MTEMDQDNKLGLPQRLRAQFASLQDRLWKVETLAALGFGLSALLLSALVLFVSDRIWDTPVWMRVSLAALGLAVLAWALLRWVKRWVLHRRDLRELAVLVQRHDRRLGDRLLGIVELADERQRPAYFSPALYRAAIEQVAAEATKVDFSAAVNPRAAKLAGELLLGLSVLAVIPFVLSPRAALNAFSRWLTPTAQIERFTLVRLTGLPAEQVVAHGEPFAMSSGVEYRSLWKPKRARYQFERQPSITALHESNQVRAQVPGQVQEGLLRVRLGDASAAVRVKPTHRPSLQELSASIQLPAYLQYPAQTQNVEVGSVTVLEGSRVQFEGKATRALSSAEVRIGDQAPQALRIQGDQFTSESIDLEAVPELTFSWRDQFGLAAAGPWRLQVRSDKDSPPTPELADLLKDTAILENEVLEIRTGAQDDFGVREVGLTWQLLTEGASTNSFPAPPFSFLAPSTHEKKVEEKFHFSPSVLAIPPDSIVELRGFATDYYPDRQRSETPVYRVHVLGNERHAELVRQNLESLLTRLEEVTRMEEKVAASTKELQQLPKEKLAADEAGERVAAAKEEQQQNAASLEQMAKEGKKTLREAMRNPTFTEETLRDWAKNLQAMQQLSQENMQAAASSLKSAQQNAEARPEKLKEAARKEQEILDALEEMQRKVNKGLDQLQALTLAQRLRKISKDEKGIAGRLQKIVPDIIGMFPKELPARFKTLEATLAEDQEAAQQQTQLLHGEIGRFFERTEKETYGQVNKEMTESRITDELDRVRSLIQENISMDAVQNLGTWSERLTGWADLLEPKSPSSGGGGGGGGGEGNSSDEALLKELLGLLRVRDRQINVRQRTALLEKQKAAPTYSESVKGLSASQGEVREDLGKVQGENPVPALEFPLQDIADEMGGVEGLLKKPQTDRTTDLAHTKTIALLSDVINLINEQQQRQENSSQSSQSPTPTAEEMAFLMQMMQESPAEGMGANPTGGGSLAGGSTDRTALPTLGNANSKAGEARTINRASGSAAGVPTEFRDALENYFQAIEKLERKR